MAPEDIFPIIGNRRSQIYQDVKVRVEPRSGFFSRLASILLIVYGFFSNLILLVIGLLKYLLLGIWTLIRDFCYFLRTQMQKGMRLWSQLFILFLICFIIVASPLGSPAQDYLFGVYNGCKSILLLAHKGLMESVCKNYSILN